MSDKKYDLGVMTALAKRLTEERLPQALALKEKVERGELLDERDMRFLENVFADVDAVKPLLDRHPEVQPIAARMMGLYKEITDQALRNEQAKGGGGS